MHLNMPDIDLNPDRIGIFKLRGTIDGWIYYLEVKTPIAIESNGETGNGDPLSPSVFVPVSSQSLPDGVG